MASALFSLNLVQVKLAAVTKALSLLSLTLALFQAPWLLAVISSSSSILDHVSVGFRAPLINHTSLGSCSDEKDMVQRPV